MLHLKHVAMFLSLGLLAADAAEAGNAKKLTRAESFLGVHFDFHAGRDCNEIGKNTTREMIENILHRVRPDYIQIDCKGHPGLSSYPTKVGNQAPGFVGDPLRLWRQVTAENRVALYMHYSGVWDSEAIKKNPSWGMINSDGKVNGNATSFFSPYANELLIPQLRELATEYGVDGVWVDGECWASVPDYGAACVEAFKSATGHTEVPKRPGEPHWFAWLEFNRDLFRKYLRNYIQEVKKTNPDFQLCSNWAFTDHMPEPVCAPVDFISGDYNPEDSVNSARLSGRYLTRQGKPWDLMAWSFTRKPGKNGSTQKPSIQLQQEAAIVLALGGGFQAYYKQQRDGSVSSNRIPVMAEVAEFCRARQEFCHHAEQVPQVAVLFSTPGHYRAINGLFSRDASPFRGTLEALIESQYSVELLGESHLEGRLQEYPLIVVPDWHYLDPTFQAKLVSYVKEGGNLLVVGPKAGAQFETEVGVKLEGRPQAGQRYLHHNDKLSAFNGPVQLVSPGKNTRSFGLFRATNDVNAVSPPAASIAKVGKGKMAIVWFAFSPSYTVDRSEGRRTFLADLVKELFQKPAVEVEGSHAVDVVLNRLKGRLMLNLINTSGPHQTEPIIEQIAPVGPLKVVIRDQRRPRELTLQPGGQKLAFDYRDGEIRTTVPPIKVHDIVVVN